MYIYTYTHKSTRRHQYAIPAVVRYVLCSGVDTRLAQFEESLA